MGALTKGRFGFTPRSQRNHYINCRSFGHTKGPKDFVAPTNQEDKSVFEYYSDTVPTTGKWLVGDIVWNNKTGSDKFDGWKCIATGEPGTWAGIESEITAKTSDYAVTETDSGTTFTNKGASGSIIFTLPSATAGLRYTFTRYADQDVIIQAATGDQINNGAPGKKYENVAAGEQMVQTTIEAIDDTQWIVVSETGTWVNNNT